MYLDYFGLTRLPFSIAPDPDLLYLSPTHHEALAHLNYALTNHGGLICLTGEVGMGKTTLCRAFIEQAPDFVDIAYIFNPILSARELLQAICNELEIPCEANDHGREQSSKQLIDMLYASLIERHSNGRKVICIIDEAQSMPAPLLEQIRLLTNLETSRDKLLTLILVGQPELQATLSQHNIRQLDQRITARFHLPAMTKQQLGPYLQHRLNQAGCKHSLFDASSISAIWQGSQGIPRLINSIADRALLGAYATGHKIVNKRITKQAINEVIAPKKRTKFLGSSLAFISRTMTVMAITGVCLWAVLAIKDSSLMSIIKGPNHYQELALAYGLEINAQYESCVGIEQFSDKQCLALDWPLTDLKRLRRPIAVFDGIKWTVIKPQQLIIQPQQALILWEPVIDFIKPIKPADSHPIIAWLRPRLKDEGDQDVHGEWTIISPTGSGSSGFDRYYDPLLANKIANFQQALGLKSDRIIGLKTLLAIQDYVDVETTNRDNVNTTSVKEL